MKRVAFKMKLFPGMEDEYRKRHDEIWPALVDLLKETGISDYSIFLEEETGFLFAVMTVADTEALNRLPDNHIMQQWWQFMGDIMETNADHSPVTVPLKEVFFL